MLTGMYGEGSVFYSESKRTWIARYPKGQFGKRIQGEGNRREKALRNRDRALKRWLVNPNGVGSTSIKAVLADYQGWLETSDRRRNTVTRKMERLNRYLKPFETLKITEIDEGVCKAIIRKAKANGKSDKSRIPNQLFSEMNQFLNWCIKHRYLASNPMDTLEKPGYVSKAKDLNEEHIDQRIKMGIWLLNFTARHTNEFGTEYGMMLAASLGLRAGEIRGLQWSCFQHLFDRDFAHTTVTVKQIYDRDAQTGEWSLQHWTKSNAKRWREIAVPEAWASNLFEYYIWFQDHHPDFPYDYRGYCFLNSMDRPFKEQLQVDRWTNLKRIYMDRNPQTAEIDRTMRLHDMRHVIASLLVINGATIEQVRPILGHIDDATTEYYTHLGAGFERKTMEKLPALLQHGINTANFVLSDWGMDDTD
ncbi:hypothetical protein KIM372_00340 [Bombiscardovia nodaiensis]|uniref:Tyr recombinase domain-containing protein n=1 Tax=Bombiscardovia nodaiensis TaxID=2932181 RepID=A0ABM8B5V2_9BIFI|nr:hypothetical protein KIM372_00340 [Bombiscardovia nodaiensis]